MSRFTVDPASLHGLEATIDDRVAHARGDLAALRAAAEQLHWRGVAAVDFGAGWAQWADGAGRLLDALHELAVAVGLSAGDYATTDDGVRAAIERTSA